MASLPDLLLRYRVLIGLLAIALSAATWAVDLAELVYQCPYCRVQRSVIGLLGVILLLPWYKHWLMRFVAAALAVFGLQVAGAQHFMGWAKISAGKFEWGERWFINPWLLSGAALFIITALLLLIWRERARG
ncbi:MAG: hypothetical protein ACKO1N_09815 [Erythrobacter sp.]